MDHSKESQNYIDYPSNPSSSQNYIGATEKAECRTCSWTGKSLGSHLVAEKNSECRRLYVEQMESEGWEAKQMKRLEDEAKCEDCHADAAELNMLVPEVKIRLAKERPFRQVFESLKS